MAKDDNTVIYIGAALLGLLYLKNRAARAAAAVPINLDVPQAAIVPVPSIGPDSVMSLDRIGGGGRVGWLGPPIRPGKYDPLI